VVSEETGGVYIDASGLVKLVIAEPESNALRHYLADGAPLYSSRIAAVEVRRVAARQAEVQAGDQVEAVLASVNLIELDESMTRAAAIAQPPELRTLDAIHLASALAIGPGLRAMVAYDDRLADAAREAGLSVEAPAASG
jgi:hypothetical protein